MVMDKCSFDQTDPKIELVLVQAELVKHCCYANQTSLARSHRSVTVLPFYR